MLCDICENGAICRYRELFEEIQNDISDVQESVQEKAKELPEFISLGVNLMCKYMKSPSYSAIQPTPSVQYPPSQFTYNPCGVQLARSTWVPTMGQYPYF